MLKFFNPWAFAAGGAVVLGVVLGLWALHAHGVAQGRKEVQSKWDRANAMAEANAARDEALAARIVADVGAGFSAWVSGIKIEHTTINRTIENEVREIPVYSECVLTDGVFAALNRIRAATQHSAVAGGSGPPVSGAAAP